MTPLIIHVEPWGTVNLVEPGKRYGDCDWVSVFGLERDAMARRLCASWNALLALPVSEVEALAARSLERRNV